MAELRDGTTTEDPRLDRLIQFDERSRQYPIRQLVAEKRPRSYTWSVRDTWLDQGREGACVGFSLAHELVARPMNAERINARYARELIYWEAQKIDPWAGGAYPGAQPFYEGTSVLAGVKVCQALGHFTEYRWAFSLQDLVLGLGYKGPAVLGVWWWDGMWDTDNAGFIHPTGSRVGGHAILAYRVKLVPMTPGPGWSEWTWGNIDRDRSYIALWNSWGPDWGVNGTAKVTLTEMGQLLADDGEAAIPVGRSRASGH